MWQLKDENRKVKQLVAEQALDILSFKAVLSKSGRPTGQAGSREDLPRGSGVLRAACLWASGIVRAMVRYQRRDGRYAEANERLQELAEERRRWGYFKEDD